MKIEICESLMQSWLKYVKRCALVTTNWKNQYELYTKNEERWELANRVYSDLKSSFDSNVDLSQFMKQAEADAVGFDFVNSKLYVVDTAFHEGGLGYSNNIKRVRKKLLRNALIGWLYFGNVDKIVSVFCSPKVRSTDDQQIAADVLALTSSLNQYKLNVDIEYLSNSLFEQQILLPTIAQAKNISDTSDLFIRSVKLVSLFQKDILTGTPLVNEQSDVDAAEDEAKELSMDILPITLIPDNVGQFKQQLLQTRKAIITVHYDDGAVEAKDWTATRFNENSDVIGNLRSRPEFKKGNWQKEGITKIVVTIPE